MALLQAVSRPSLRLFQPRFGEETEREPARPLPPGVEPKTGLGDLWVGKRAPDKNGVGKMDINPLLDDSDWFRIDGDYQGLIAQKKVLLQNYRDAVSATLPEGEAGAKELLETMADYLPRTFPDQFEKQGRILTNNLTGDVFDLDHLQDDPIRVAAQLVQEDLVLIHPDEEGHYRVTSGAVCFPSNWNLREKLGKTIHETHDPVSTLNDSIGAMVDRFLGRMNPDRRFWRINFLTVQNPALTQVPEHPDLGTDGFRYKRIGNRMVEDMLLRSEREVFTKLPNSGDILFSLKTYITPFKDLPPAMAGHVRDLIENLPAGFVKGYKGWTPRQKAIVVDYLNRLAGDS